MIPVLGIPILNRPDMLRELLGSIDYPIGRVLIIDNGNVVPESEVEDAAGRGITIVKPGHNLGVAASWNSIIRATPQAPWWMISNFDLAFAPGDLERLDKHMETQGGIALLGSFSAFGLDREVVKKVGLFDENFHPAYFEDNDFDYRARMAEVPFVSLPAGLTHRISSTLNNSLHYQRRNSETFPANREYFQQKWGGQPYREVYTTPFNAGGDPRAWTLDIDRLAQQIWTPEESLEKT
jgi:GT2 family glycosyltransferase